MDWLETLETAVAKAGERVAELKKENRALAARLKRLEKEAAAVGTASGEAREKERATIRRRVETLIETLEELLREEG